jgi:hypothetical protein
MNKVKLQAALRVRGKDDDGLKKDLLERLLPLLSENTGVRKQRGVRTSPGQIQALWFYFIDNQAETWTSTHRNAMYKVIIKHPLFDNLKISHICTRWNVYQGYCVAKKSIGSSYYQASRILATDSFASSLVVEILSHWYGWFSHYEPEYYLPKELYGLLSRCSAAMTAIGAGDATPLSSNLHLDDRALITSYVPMIVIFHSLYCNQWANFSIVERQPINTASAKLDLVMAGIELLFNDTRRRWTIEGDVTNLETPYGVFYSITSTGILFTNATNPCDLYPDPVPDDKMVDEAVAKARYDLDFDELQKILFRSFEECCWSVYLFNLTVLQMKAEIPPTTLTPEQQTEVTEMDAAFITDMNALLPEHFDVDEQEGPQMDNDNEGRGGGNDNERDSTAAINTSAMLWAAHRTVDVTQQGKQVAYYVTGAALHAALGLCYDGSEEVKLLKENLCFADDKQAILSSEVPCQLTVTRQRNRLLYPKKHVYDVMQSLESDVLIPLLGNNRLLACLRNMLSRYVETQVEASGVYERMAIIFAKALGWTKVERAESTAEESIEEECLSDYQSNAGDDKSLPERLATKMVRYYVGSTFNDFIAHKARALEHDRDFSKRVAFRMKVLTKRIVSYKDI